MEQVGKHAGNKEKELKELLIQERQKRLEEAQKELEELFEKYKVGIEIMMSYDPTNGFQKQLILIDKDNSL